MITTQIDIRAEIVRVQGEVIFFRDKCLPAFFDTPIDAVFEGEYADWVREKSDGRLSKWQEATRRLAELLPLGPLAPNAAKLSREDFREFLFQEATSSFCIRDGRIVWSIRLFMDPTLWSAYCPAFPSSALEIPDRVPEIRRWMMGLPVDSPELANALCMALPFIADADPSFAKLALDPATWSNLVLNDRGISEERRTKRLKVVDGPWFAHVLNNSLLHVLGALANNNFMAIEYFLDHPYLCGGYTHLMPHYVFAVLVEKVATLRTLSTDRPDLW